MGITSVQFACFALIAIGLFNILPNRWRAPVLFPAASAAFLWLQMPDPLRIAALLSFSVFAWLLVCLVRARRALSTLFGAIALLVVVYYFIRASGGLGELIGSDHLVLIGIAYILVRALQVILDTREDPSVAPGLPAFLVFLLAWPTLISGPIQRWQDFRKQYATLAEFKLDWTILNRALGRIILGLLFVLVLGDAFRRLWSVLSVAALQSTSPLALGAAELTFFIYLTFDFVGYTEIVIGLALLCGFRLPENFNRPWLATSYLDFWSRWHMTLAGFFKTYVFNTVLRDLTYRQPDKRFALLHAAVAFFVTFFLVGLWHGATWHFVVCGLLLAIGAMGNQLLRSASRVRRTLKAMPAPVAAWLTGALTLTYVCFSIMPLWLSSLSWAEAGRVFVSGYGLSGLVSANLVAFGLLLPIIGLIRVAAPLPSLVLGRYRLGPFLAGAALASIHIYGTMFPVTAINFIYQAF